MTVLIDMVALIFPYIGVVHHIECDMVGLKYLTLDTNSPESMNCPQMVLFYWRVYDED